MEASNEPISIRVSRLNNYILSKNISEDKRLISRESLFDALNILFDECNNENLKKNDKNMTLFVDKFRRIMLDVKKLRVNITDFEIKKVIGRGHFGEVHLVREKQTKDVYAMKTLKKSDTLNKKNISFYEEERDIMAQTTSPWITSLFYAFQDSVNLYLIMEFHPGGDLFALLQRNNGILPENDCKFYLAELTLAISAIHSMGYVHRDIKPENILIDRCGHLKLADFGSAARLSSDGKVTSQMPVGTPEYIAPEVLKSVESNVSYGVECDYWSLGIVAYEMCIGQTPFASEGLPSIHNSIMNFEKHLEFPTDCNVTEEYKQLISGLLVKSNKRFKYSEIKDSKFFKTIDWISLRDQVPPFVPIVNSEDDTSNFTEYEPKSHMPCIDNFKSKMQFSSKNLPFVGFTYTHDLGNNTQALDLDSSFKSCSSNKSIIENKKKEVDHLHKRLAKLETHSKEMESLKGRFVDSKNKINDLEKARENLERELALSSNQILHLKRTLEAERLERKELETKALDLIKCAQKKWQTAENERLTNLNKKLEENTERITELCTLNNTLSNELERKEKELKSALEEMANLKHIHNDYQNNLAKVRQISRRSVADCHVQINKLANDNYLKIDELKQELENEKEHRKKLENQLNDFQIIENKLKTEINSSENENKILKRRIDELQTKYKDYDQNLIELNKLKIEFNKSIESNLTISNDLANKVKEEKQINLKLKVEVNNYINRIDILQNNIDTLENNLKDTKNESEKKICYLKEQFEGVQTERNELREKLRQSQESEEISRNRVNDLEKIIERLEQGVAKLEANDNNSSPINNFEDQIKRLESQLASAHENLALEKQNARQARTALRKKERELTDCELDKKIAERELKDAEQKIKILQNEIKELKQKLESEKIEYKKINEDKDNQLSERDLKIDNLQFELDKKMKQSESDKESWIEEKQSLMKRIDQLNKYEISNEQLNSEIREVEKDKAILMMQVKDLQSIKRTTDALLEKAKTDLQNMEKLYQEQCRNFENIKLNNSALKDGCVMLEDQLEKYEGLISVYQDKQKLLETEKQSLQEKLNDVQLELTKAKQQINEEKSLKLLAENRSNQNEMTIKEMKEQIETLSNNLNEYKSSCKLLNDQLQTADGKVSKLDIDVKTYERLIENHRQEEIILKEERSKLLTTIHKLKESNLKMKLEMDELKDNEQELEEKVRNLEQTLEEQTIHNRQREIKSQGTIEQQTKLIHYLQAKLDEIATKKKKGFMDNIFGSSKKENLPPFPAELISSMGTLKNSAKSDIEVKYQTEKLKNKNLTDQINTLKAKLDLYEKNKIEIENNSKKSFDEIEKATLDGWVKLFNDEKMQWNKYFLKLIKSKLYVLPNEESKSALKIIDLDPKYTPTLVTNVTENECGNTVKSDLPFIFKISTGPETTCWPQNIIYIMALSESSKKSWITVLQQLIPNKNNKLGSLIHQFTNDNQLKKLNCLLELELDVLLLGTDNGLYSIQLQKNKITQLKGPTRVLQMKLCRTLGIAIFICGENNNLCKFYQPQLNSLAKSASITELSIDLQLINNDSYILFESGQISTTTSGGVIDVVLCGATKNKIVIMKHNAKIQNFMPVRMLDTAIPCSCMLIREHSLILGANKFFEIDLSDFSAEEFLDNSDTSLAHVIYSYKVNSYPIAFFDVTSDNNANEYLLCYHEFAVFVDEFGMRSRKDDLQWKNRPIKCVYASPYLFVFSLKGLDLIKIYSKKYEYQQLELNYYDITYLGISDMKKSAVYCNLSNEEIRLVQASKLTNDVSITDDELSIDDENNVTDYSVSSSIIESLDRDGSTENDS